MTREILGKGKHLQLIRSGKDEFVERIGVTGVVNVLAIDKENRLLLLEHFRTPVGARVIELPGGMAGDEDAGESLEDAARRELQEETGYESRAWRKLGEGPSSAGLTSEIITFFLARHVVKTGEPREEDAKKATLHLVAQETLDTWLGDMQRGGARIDYRIYAALRMMQEN